MTGIQAPGPGIAALAPEAQPPPPQPIRQRGALLRRRYLSASQEAHRNGLRAWSAVPLPWRPVWPPGSPARPWYRRRYRAAWPRPLRGMARTKPPRLPGRFRRTGQAMPAFRSAPVRAARQVRWASLAPPLPGWVIPPQRKPARPRQGLSASRAFPPPALRPWRQVRRRMCPRPAQNRYSKISV